MASTGSVGCKEEERGTVAARRDPEARPTEKECPVTKIECDIRQERCQERIFETTACASGLSGSEPPPVRTIDLETLEAEVSEQLAMEEPDPFEERWNEALRFLGLLPFGQSAQEGSAAVTVANVLAYYDAEEQSVTVIDRGDMGDLTEDLFELSHEFTHALRDAESDLIGFREQWASSTDSFVATTTLIEGEAMVVAADVVSRAHGNSAWQVDWDAFADNIEQNLLDELLITEQPFFNILQGLPYALGTRRLGPIWSEDGRDAIDAMYEEPDLSLLDWVGGGASAVQPLDCYPTTPPEGYVADDQDSLGLAGVFGLRVTLAVTDPETAYERSHYWRNDRLVTFRLADDPEATAVAVAWRVRFDSDEHASAFADEVGSSLPLSAQAVAEGREVTLFATSDPMLVDSWTDATACGAEEDLPPSHQGMDVMMDDLRRMR